MGKHTLTIKQKAFASEYICDLNATEAYYRAGYNPKTRKQARSSASTLLQNPDVAEFIQELMQQRSLATEVTAERVVLELARIAFSDLREFMAWSNSSVTWKDSDELSDESAPALAEVSETEREMDDGGFYRTRRFKLHDKLSALKILSQHTGISGPVGQGINIQVGSLEEQKKSKDEGIEKLFKDLDNYREEVEAELPEPDLPQ